jgi:Putative auto-transporter adhesin, head GIN domain
MTVAPTPLHPRPAHHRAALLVALATGVVALAIVAVVAAVRTDVFNSSSTSTTLHGSGVAATQARPVAAFTAVELAGAANVAVTAGRARSVVVHADDNLLRHVTTRVQAGRLVIGTVGSFTTETPMTLQVTVPTVDAVTLSGSGVVAVIDASAARLSIVLSGSGIVAANGRVGRLDVTVSGSGTARLMDLVAQTVHATVSGSGEARVTATHELNASIPGSGAVIYAGKPAHLTTSVTGSGIVLPD